MSTAMAVWAGSDNATLPVDPTATLVPTQPTPLRPPVSKSQYVPGANPVGTVTVSVVLSRLIATNPFVLGVVILQKHHGFVGRHESPGSRRELAPGWSVGIELRDVLPVETAELVADSNERELGDVRRAAGAICLAEIIDRLQCVVSAAAHLEEPVRNRPPFRAHRRVHERQDAVELHLLDVFSRVDAKAGDAEAREHDQITGDLLSYRRQPGVEI